MLDRCFPPFGISNDSTPCSAKAEAVVLRVVITDTFEILDILVAFDVLEDNLDIKVDSHNIIYVIISDAKRDPKYCCPAMQDRPATNRANINLLNDEIA